LSVRTSDNIPQEKNFVFLGLKKFREITGIDPQFEIYIEKKIPVGGGLGGGSSNLATVLSWINDFFGKPLKREELLRLLSEISSDAPAFLCDGVALAEGRGERITCLNLKSFKARRITLIVPKDISSPTGLIYSRTSPDMFSSAEKVERIKTLLKEDNLERFLKFIENPLGEIFLQLHPDVAKDIDTIRKNCYKNIFVSGSGSSLFAVGSLNRCGVLDKLKLSYKIIPLATL
jgi:4-diphosphocytidyl-2-C-methyl-D-erythritol kinase